ncbi:MAG: hypothetical protein AAF479_06005 [Pseudomonadota bacterium]
MTEKMEGRGGLDIEMTLQTLAEEVRDASPRPGPDLMARVLADAAAMAPVAAGGVAVAAQSQRGGAGILDMLFGWTGGAVAAMALSLALGIGIGMELEPGDLPMTEADLVQEYAAAGGSLLNDDFL